MGSPLMESSRDPDCHHPFPTGGRPRTWLDRHFALTALDDFLFELVLVFAILAAALTLTFEPYANALERVKLSGGLLFAVPIAKTDIAVFEAETGRPADAAVGSDREEVRQQPGSGAGWHLREVLVADGAFALRGGRPWGRGRTNPGLRARRPRAGGDARLDLRLCVSTRRAAHPIGRCHRPAARVLALPLSLNGACTMPKPSRETDALARHARHLAAAGVPRDEADRRLAGLFGADALRAWRDRADAWDVWAGPIFAAIVARGGALGLAPADLGLGLEALREELAGEIAPIGRAFGGTFATLLATASVATCVLAVMGLFVIPEMRGHFVGMGAGMGAELPALTRLVFETEVYGLVFAVPWVALLLLLANWIGLRSLHLVGWRVPGWVRVLPLLGPAARRLEGYAMINLYRLLRRLGAACEPALAVIGEALGHRDALRLPPLLADIKQGLIQAERLRIEDREIAYWDRFLDARNGMALEMLRRLLTYVLLALVAVVVGLMVIALYLPLFKIASVV